MVRNNMLENTKSLNSTYDSIKSKGDHLAHDAANWVEAEFAAVTEIASKSLKNTSTRILSMIKQSGEFVRKNPILTVAASVALGYVAARMMNVRKPNAELRH